MHLSSRADDVGCTNETFAKSSLPMSNNSFFFFFNSCFELLVAPGSCSQAKIQYYEDHQEKNNWFETHILKKKKKERKIIGIKSEYAHIHLKVWWTSAEVSSRTAMQKNHHYRMTWTDLLQQMVQRVNPAQRRVQDLWFGDDWSSSCRPHLPFRLQCQQSSLPC